MKVIHTNTLKDSWRQTFLALCDADDTDNDKYWRDEPVLIEVASPDVRPEPLFPMAQEDLNLINRYIVTGEQEERVCHEWTKLYYHRIFDEPLSQYRYFLEKLRATPPVGEAQISLWDKARDQDAAVSPCTQILWGRLRDGALELHVHAHSSDAYKKLLMNMQEFVSFQHHVAAELGCRVGKYLHFIDSCHLHHKDLEKIRLLEASIAMPST